MHILLAQGTLAYNALRSGCLWLQTGHTLTLADTGK
jgi:hypothetical protein